MSTHIRLVEMPEDTTYAPLGVLGYCLTHTDFLSIVFSELNLPLKTVEHEPRAKLGDILVSILAGCRSLVQVNTRIRPDQALATAWGRAQFAEQSTLARTLDAFTLEQVDQLRTGCEALFRRHSRTFQHDFEQDWLWLDIDLTSLPISKRAEGSTKGRIGREKTRMVGNWPACMRHSIMRRSFLGFTRATSTVNRSTSPCCASWMAFSSSAWRRNSAPSCVRMPGSAAMTTSTLPWMKAGKS